MTSQIDSQRRRRRLLFAALSLLLVVGIVGGVATFATDSIRNFISRFQVADYSGEPMTLVVFELKEVEGGTQLKIVESGFDQVPAARRLEAFQMNSHGWDAQIRDIAIYVTK